MASSTPPTTRAAPITGGTISANTITGHIGVFKATGPDLGGIVLATASVHATLSGTLVNGNSISGSFEGGIIVHSHVPNDVVSDVTITDNTVGPANNWGQTNGPPTTAGIIVGVDVLPPAIAPKITTTSVTANTIMRPVLRRLDQRGDGYHHEPGQHDHHPYRRHRHLQHPGPGEWVLAGRV